MADVSESLNQENQKIKPIALILVIATVLIIAFIGLGFAYSGTMTVITCQRTEQVDCTITEKLFGLYPVQEQQIANLLTVSHESETRTSTSTGSGSGSGRRKGKGGKKIITETTTGTTTYYKLVFHAGNGSMVKTSENTSYSWTTQTVTRFNNFLANSTEKRISARHIRWVPMIIASCFLFIPALVFYYMSKSLFRFIIRQGGGQ